MLNPHFHSFQCLQLLLGLVSGPGSLIHSTWRLLILLNYRLIPIISWLKMANNVLAPSLETNLFFKTHKAKKAKVGSSGRSGVPFVKFKILTLRWLQSK